MRRVLPTRAAMMARASVPGGRLGGQLAQGRVGDHEVVEVDPGRAAQLGAGGGLGGGQPLGGGLLGGAQRAAQREGGTALLVVEVAVAAREGQAVGLADGLSPEHVDPEAQVRAHPPDQRQLLVVLLAEHRHVGPDQPEQLGHDRQHAGEVAGSRRALEDRGQRAGVDGDLRRTSRVDLVDRRREEHVDALGARRARGPPRTCAGSGRGPRPGPNCSGFTNSDTTRGASGPISARVRRIRLAWPSCIAPIVQTRPTRSPRARRGASRSASSWRVLASTGDNSVPQMCSRGETGASTAASESSST